MNTRKTQIKAVAGAGLLVALYLVLRSMMCAPAPNAITAALEPLHLSMTPSRDERTPNGAEPGQTFAQYRGSFSKSGYSTLYVQPIGALDARSEQLVVETAELLAVTFSAPTKVLDPISSDLIPEAARRNRSGSLQFSSLYILDKVLKPRRPEDALAVLAISATDLYPEEGWNFVFGQASLSERIGVWSLHRYGDPGSEEFRRRLFKVAMHETGHMFGIAHCVAYECLMNYAGSRLALDRAPMWFCPECVQKVAFARGVDLPGYFSNLAAFAKSHNLPEEAVYWSKSRDAVVQSRSAK